MRGEAGLTDSSDEHGEPPEGGDGVGEVLLGVVQLLDVAADLLHHHLALLRLPPDLIRLHEQVLDHQLGFAEILPVARPHSQVVLISDQVLVAFVEQVCASCKVLQQRREIAA